MQGIGFVTPNTPKSVGCFSYLNISSSCASLEREIQDRTDCKFKSNIHLFWRRKWQPTSVFLPGESHAQRSLAGCSLWGCTESDTTEVTKQHQHIYFGEGSGCPLQYSCLENPMDRGAWEATILGVAKSRTHLSN